MVYGRPPYRKIDYYEISVKISHNKKNRGVFIIRLFERKKWVFDI